MRILKSLLLVAALFLAHAPSACAQQIRFDATKEIDGDSGYQVEWEPLLRRLIFYRNVSNPALDAVRVMDASGKDTALYPLKDFPGADHIDVWDAQGAPNGDIVLAAVLAYGPRNNTPVPVKSLLLTYDSQGTLRRVWDVKPYHHHHIAIDSVGNVFALGDGGSGTDYPLLIKYSPQGEVLSESMPSSLFPEKDNVVDSNAQNGEPQVIVSGNRVLVYLALNHEILSFSPDGTLISRVSLGPTVQRITESTGSSSIRIARLSLDSKQNIVAHIRLVPKDVAKSATVALSWIKPDGSYDSLIPAPNFDTQRFLGLTVDDRPVYLQKLGRRSVMADLSK